MPALSSRAFRGCCSTITAPTAPKGWWRDKAQPYFAISSRMLIQDDVILARYDANGKPYTYSLEPQFLADTRDACWNIPWNYGSGEMAAEVTGPDGATVSLGRY